MSSKRAFLRRAALAALAVGTVTALAVQPAMADRWKKNRGWYGGGYVVAQPYVGYYAPPPVVFYPPPPVGLHAAGRRLRAASAARGLRGAGAGLRSAQPQLRHHAAAALTKVQRIRAKPPLLSGAAAPLC